MAAEGTHAPAALCLGYKGVELGPDGTKMGKMLVPEPSALVPATTGPVVVGAEGIISSELLSMRILVVTLVLGSKLVHQLQGTERSKRRQISPI